MIVGREAQQAELTRLIDLARDEHASTVSLVGPPGIGKTALLEDTCLRAPAEYSVWRVRGVPADQSIAFAAIQPMLRELWPHREVLTARQRNSLGHAMGTTQDRPGSDDPLALGSGVLELLGAAAHLNPILLAIDDAQWLDADSRALLGFVIRRLGGERVVVLSAAHTTEQLPDSTGAVLELVDLPRVDAAAVVRDLRPDASGGTVDRLYELSGGNPLALLEMVNQLQADEDVQQLATFDARTLSTRTVSVFAPRISVLTVQAQQALLVAACEGRIDKLSVVKALGLLGIEPPALTAVLDAGLLVETDGRLALRHPLVGAAVLSMMSDEEIRNAHAALADSLAASDSERSMWHRAASIATTDESVAVDLLAFAQRARERASYDSARRAAELAASTAASRATRVEALVLAAEMAFAQGDLRQAEVLLTRIRGLGDLPDEIDARCLLATSRIAIRRGQAAAGTRDFLAATLRLPTKNREPLLRELLLYAVTGGDLGLAEDIFSSPGAEELDGYTCSLVEAYVAMASLAASAPAGAADLVSDILNQLPADADQVTAEIAGDIAVELGRFVQARGLYSRGAASSRDNGDIVGLASSTSNIAFIELSVGRWNRAYALGLEVIDLVGEQMLPGVFASILPLLAEIDAARGREVARTWCRRAHALGQELGQPELVVLAERREGLLDFGLGQWDAAERRFRAALKEADDNDITHPFFRATPDLVEVLLRQGRREEAVLEAESFLKLVGPGMAAPPLARALRLRGMFSDDGFDTYFLESLAIDDKIGLAFQGARTRLVYGERLRRERRRSDARAVLAAALDTFVQLDAVPWIDRTSSEFAATGGPATVQSGPAIAELLSPQEMQVASLVADGRRNKEIAEQLFMSERTVESHLSRTYRKLGVANRTQLSRAFSGEGASD